MRNDRQRRPIRAEALVAIAVVVVLAIRVLVFAIWEF